MRLQRILCKLMLEHSQYVGFCNAWPGSSMSNGNYHSAVPVIATDDVRASVNYFVNKLGFETDFMWGDPPVYASVRAGDVEIYFAHDPAMSRAIRELGLTPDLFLWVNDVDEIYARHRANGVEIIEGLVDQPWGARQFVIRELNGYHLKIAQPARQA